MTGAFHPSLVRISAGNPVKESITQTSRSLTPATLSRARIQMQCAPA